MTIAIDGGEEDLAEEDRASALDAGPDSLRRAPVRTCIVTRWSGPKEALVRFVLGPDGQVTPDIKARLPGRGAWVVARKARVAEAARKGAFARAFRKPVPAAPDLADLVDRLLEAQAIASVSLANKAGAMIAGREKVEGALAEGRVAALIEAADGASDGQRKMAAAARRLGAEPATIRLFGSAQLDLALGRMNVVHAALLAGPASETVLQRCAALLAYRTGDDPDARPGARAGASSDPITAEAPPGAGTTE